MIIPPFSGVTLVEYRDRIELTPFEWVPGVWHEECVGPAVKHGRGEGDRCAR